MTTFDSSVAERSTSPAEPEPTAPRPSEQGELASPFALTNLAGPQNEGAEVSLPSMASPFLDGFMADDSVEADRELAEQLLAELEDEEFAGALEALANEAAARSLRAPTLWQEADQAPLLDPTDAEQWMEAIEARADQMLAELEQHFAERAVESVGDDEIDQILEAGFPTSDEFGDPLDAQELFFGKLKRKLKKVARGARNLVKKGIKLASKFLPLGLIFRRLRPIIRPLLRRVLAKAIGKLPRSLRGPARRLAKRYGLREAEVETDFEYFAAEFDAETVEAMLADEAEFAALEAELQAEDDADRAEVNVAQQLDTARLRLGRELERAEPGQPPTEAMEQFVPVVLHTAVKLGIRVAGRRRVVRFVAGLLARLIAPIVGKRLARPLSIQIADKGLRLLRLEAAEDNDQLGTEAMVAAAEEAIQEVFELPEEWLENEMLLEMAVEEAFHKAARRRFPDSALRSELAESAGDDERGVWLMMPRGAGPTYRYIQHSKVLPVTINPQMARSVVFSSGETLEDRLHDEGADTWPVQGEVELYELLPGGEIGHIAAAESPDGAEAMAEMALEFDTIEEAGELPLPEEEWRRRSRRRSPRRRVLRVKVRGRGLRRRSPVSVRLDATGTKPSLRLHVTVGERRALAIVEKLGKNRHREAVSILRRLTGRPIRKVVGRRLQAMLARRRLKVEAGTGQQLSDRLFDGLIGALASQMKTLAPALTAAAKDPAAGLTITATFGFASKDALVAGKPGHPELTVRPGRHRD